MVLTTAVSPEMVVGVKVGNGVSVGAGVAVSVGRTVEVGDGCASARPVVGVADPVASGDANAGASNESMFGPDRSGAADAGRETGGPLKAPVSGVAGVATVSVALLLSLALAAVNASDSPSGSESCNANASGSVVAPNGTPARKKAMVSNSSAKA